MNEATKAAREAQLTKVIRLEIAAVVSRTAKPPAMRAKDGKPAPDLAPFTDKEAWLPLINVKVKNKWVQQKPTTGRQACIKMLFTVQKRLRHAGNLALTELLKSANLPLAEPVTLPGRAKPQRVPEPGKTRAPFDTIAYQKVCEYWPDPKELPTVGARNCSALSRRITTLFNKWVKSQGAARLSTVTESWPIPIRADAWCMTRDDGFNLAFNLDGTWWEVGLRPIKKNLKQSADPYVTRTLAHIAAGEPHRGKPSAVPQKGVWIPGELGLQYRNKKWYAIIQYRQPKPVVKASTTELIVHCGLRNFVVAGTADEVASGRFPLCIDGLDLLEVQRNFRQRRQRLQSTRKLRRPGHGHQQAVKKLSLNDRAARWTDNWVRRVAARVVRKAAANNARIHLMDLENIRTRSQHSDLPGHIKVRVHGAPWFKFKEYVLQGAQARGLEVASFKPAYHTQRCPTCGNVSQAGPQYRKWRYVCLNCGALHRNLDVMALANACIDLNLIKVGDVVGWQSNVLREHNIMRGLNEGSDDTPERGEKIRGVRKQRQKGKSNRSKRGHKAQKIA